MDWLPIGQYPVLIPEYDSGPEVLFAWRRQDGSWDFGVGWGRQRPYGDPDAEPTYWVGDWDVAPTHFAFVKPPEGA